MTQKVDYRIAPPEALASDMGQRLERLRVAQNITQATLADHAGVSRRTITRMENGEGVTLDTLIRVLRALGVVERLEVLIPDAAVRPIERVRRQGRERKYAREKHADAVHTPWRWDDGASTE